jgi:pyridoxal phosphate enzyme (YggS family)
LSIAQNLSRVREELAEASRKSGRTEASVKLMAVSKVHPAEAIVEAYEAGQRLFGENRVQELAEKSAIVSALNDAEFHLIGPLQNNKTTKAAELFHAIDTLDSVKTARRLHDAALALGKVLPVLVEVKLSHEESKHGLAPEALAGFLDETRELHALRVCGLMTVPPWSEDAETARPYFRTLRELREQHSVQHPGLVELSMGMSNDYCVAVEEGSTVVRVGTAIFGSRVGLKH